MAEETWRIVLEESYSSPTGTTPSSSGSQAGRDQQQAARETVKAAPMWQNVGRFTGSLLGVAGIIALVFMMIRRSKIFSTFMDSFLTVLSTVVDILFIPLVPLILPVLKLLLGFIPIATAVSKVISTFLEDPWSGAKSLFEKIPNAIFWLGEFLNMLFSNMGLSTLGNVFTGIAGEMGGAIQKIVPMFELAIGTIRDIWGTEGLSFWDKMKLTAEAVWKFVKDAATPMWEAIKNIWRDIVVPFIKEEWSKFWNNTVAPFFTDTLPSMLGQALGTGVQGTWKGFWDTITGESHFWDWMIPFYSHQLGGYVPQDMISLLHRGETVIPAGRASNTYNKPITISNTFNITTDPSLISRHIATTLDQAIRSSAIQGW